MRTCCYCMKEMNYSVGIFTTNLAFPILSDKKLYENDDRLIGVCVNADCNYYGLLQIALENMPNGKQKLFGTPF